MVKSICVWLRVFFSSFIVIGSTSLLMERSFSARTVDKLCFFLCVLSSRSTSEEKSTPTTPLGSKRTANPSPSPGGGSTHSSDRGSNNSPSLSTAASATGTGPGPVSANSLPAAPSTCQQGSTTTPSVTVSTCASQSSAGLVRAATFTATDSPPQEPPIVFNEDDQWVQIFTFTSQNFSVYYYLWYTATGHGQPFLRRII